MKNTKKIVYNYDPFITVFKENFNNKYQLRKNFHKIKLQDAAMVILENEKNQILFLNEYRRGIKKESLGFPGGHIESGDEPLKTAKRELLEETGYIARNWKRLFKYTRHGTYHCGQDYIYTAKIDSNLPKKRNRYFAFGYDSYDIALLLNNPSSTRQFKYTGMSGELS